MSTLPAEWSTQQLAEFLATVSRSTDRASALRRAVERAAEAFDAEAAVVIGEDDIAASVGFGTGRVPADALIPAVDAAEEKVGLPGLGVCHLMTTPLELGPDRLAVVRAGEDPFVPEERNLLRGMARVLVLTLEMLERQRLLERLSRIQRSISHRAPLQEVLDAITAGALDLLGTDTAGLRILDPQDPTHMLLVSSSGILPDTIETIRRRPISEGAGGRAIAENRLVLVADYESSLGTVPEFVEQRMQAAMAAPVHEDGRAIGSLVVGSYRTGRGFTETEQQALLALAEHASLALTDAKTVEAMRDAQRSRDMFLAMVSHELKTPLTVMMGALRTLELHGEGIPRDVIHELISSGYERGKELERLIDKLLMGARAQLAGESVEVFLPSLMGAAVRGFDRTRTIEVAPVPPETVHVDRGAVEQVVGALLENAVTHSPPAGRIRVTVTLDGAQAAVEVANPGSLPEDLGPEELFSPFRRGSDARSPGVGLGLYIARRVAESIGGTIDARSDGGEVGFTLRFPCGVPAPEATAGSGILP